MKSIKRTRGNGHSASLDPQLKRLQIRLKSANRQAAKGIELNIRKFGTIARAAEKDLKRLRGVGKQSLKTFRSELKRSWNDLKRIAYQQF